MNSPVSSPPRPSAWISLWVVALVSLLGQLWLCQFFTFGKNVPETIDVNPANLWKLAYHFPPTGTFEVLNWLGGAYLPQPLNPLSLAAQLPAWIFFSAYAPVMATLSLLAMAAFLRELECPRPAALFGGVVFAWQGDILPFVFPAHYGYITSWPFFALAAWGALRAQRTRHWAYALISGACCGVMVSLETNADRGAIASLLIAALYAAPVVRRTVHGQSPGEDLFHLRHLALCAVTALLISLASFLALFQSNIVGVKLAGQNDPGESYKFVTQYSLGPAETLTYLVPGFFGWHMSNSDGPYWGAIGRTLDWPKTPGSTRNSNLAISTTGTIATVLALLGAGLLLPGRLLGPDGLSERQRFYGRVLLIVGLITLVLAWGWHTPLYRPLFALPLMDKWRNPLKWLEMTNFALVTLSALGAQHLMASLDIAAPDVKLLRQRLAWFSGGMLALLGLAVLASFPYAAFALPTLLQAQGYDQGQAAAIMATMTFSLKVALFCLSLFCLLLWLLWRPEKMRGLTLVNPLLHRLWQRMWQAEYLPLTLALGLAGLSSAQLGWVTSHFVQPTELAPLTASNPLLDALAHDSPQVRCSALPQDPLLGFLMLNQFNIDKIACVDISAASRIPDDINEFFVKGPLRNNQARIWFLAGVKNVAIPEQALPQLRSDPDISANVERADGYTLEPTSSPNLPSHAIVVMRDYLAKATLAPNAEVIASPDAMLKRMADPGWNPRESVLLNAPAAALPTGGDQFGDPNLPDNVEVDTYTPTRIEIEVDSAKGGYVLINDQFDPDWKTQVNGRDAELLRADFLMRAVRVPPGDALITMRYVAHYRVAGLELPVTTMNLFSDGSLLAAWGVAGIALWRRKSPVPPVKASKPSNRKAQKDH